MESLVKKFLKENKITTKINGDLTVAKESDPEVIVFIKYDKEKKLWKYGSIHRGIEEIEALFQEKEEALMYAMYDYYQIGLSIKLRREYLDDFLEINEDNEKEQMNYIEDNIDRLYLEKLKIKDNDNLIYLDKFIIPKQGLSSNQKITKYYFYELFSVMAYDKVVNELINFGFDKKELDKYFKFEEFEVISFIK